MKKNNGLLSKFLLRFHNNYGREFDEYFFVMNPKLTEETILRLFLGDTWKKRGILHFIG